MKFLISTGGSGGHIFPALQTGIELRRRGHDVIFAGVLSMSLDKIRSMGFEAKVIDAEGLNDKSLKGLLRFAMHMIVAIGEALKGIDNIRPDKVIGFGGYGSFPIIVAACLRGYRTMIHEQNVVPGRANKVLSLCVTNVAVSFKQTMSVFGKKSVWTGCPCNNQPILKSTDLIRQEFGLRPTSKVIVLLGGSQGSKFLNETFFNTMKHLLLDTTIEAVHVSGKADCGLYQEKYGEADLPVIVKEFISPIEDLYAVADVIVSRSGAATVSELGYFGIQSILVPYPYAQGHQEHNAKVLVQAGTATLIHQKDLTEAILLEVIQQHLNKSRSRETLQQHNAPFFVSNAVIQLANAIEVI